MPNSKLEILVLDCHDVCDDNLNYLCHLEVHFLPIHSILRKLYKIRETELRIVKEYPNNNFVAEATSEHVFFEGNSKEEIKKKILEWVDNMFHPEMKPHYIRFKYSKEELIKISK